jgi:hypothetical protein
VGVVPLKLGEVAWTSCTPADRLRVEGKDPDED